MQRLGSRMWTSVSLMAFRVLSLSNRLFASLRLAPGCQAEIRSPSKFVRISSLKVLIQEQIVRLFRIFRCSVSLVGSVSI